MTDISHIALIKARMISHVNKSTDHHFVVRFKKVYILKNSETVNKRTVMKLQVSEIWATQISFCECLAPKTSLENYLLF